MLLNGYIYSLHMFKGPYKLFDHPEIPGLNMIPIPILGPLVIWMQKCKFMVLEYLIPFRW